MNGALKRFDICALFLGHGDVKGQHPWGRRIDRHGCVHLFQRNFIEQCAHIAQVADRNAHFANLATGKGMVTVIPCLCRQVEGHRQARLTLGQVRTIERI